MGKIQPFSIGERVTRKSYNHDVLFRVASVKQEYAFLHGEDIRLIADAPMSDLQIIEERELKKKARKRERKGGIFLPFVSPRLSINERKT